MKVKVKKLFGDVVLPTYATKGSAGFDLQVDNFKQLWDSQSKNQHKANKTEEDFVDVKSVMLNPHSRLLVGTGIAVAIPEHFEMQIRPRSGNALKKGLTVINAPGTIDSDYRLEVGVILINTSEFDVEVSIGDKVAQGVVTGYCKVVWQETDKLDETTRKGGYGSTDYNVSDNPIDPSL